MLSCSSFFLWSFGCLIKLQITVFKISVLNVVIQIRMYHVTPFQNDPLPVDERDVAF